MRRWASLPIDVIDVEACHLAGEASLKEVAREVHEKLQRVIVSVGEPGLL